MSESRPELRSRGVLDVFLGNELLGQLEDRTLGYVAFDFTEQTILNHGAGSRLLSLSMPMAFESVDVFIATAFFAGLLPEGAARQRLADEFRIGAEDTWALLQVLGRESAGALVILPEGDRPIAPGHVELQPLTDQQLATELDALTISPLGVTVRTEEVRLSLAGVQDKLPLVRLDEGALALPVGGHPSNIIAKPERARGDYPGLVANEAFCLAVSAELGIPTASFSVVHLDLAGDMRQMPVLLVDRYDRVRDDGTLLRLHQEDACQAAAIHPNYKYEGRGGPSLARVAALISEFSAQPALDRIALYRLAILNGLIANADAHGKNVSFLHTPDGVQLAPAYDLVSTAAYPHLSDVLAMRIGGVERIADLTRQACLDCADEIAVGARLADRLLGEMEEQLPTAMDAALARARQAGWAAPIVEQIAEATRERAARVFAR
jgi:serine/threonine-protein kinase HipA